MRVFVLSNDGESARLRGLAASWVVELDDDASRALEALAKATGRHPWDVIEDVVRRELLPPPPKETQIIW